MLVYFPYTLLLFLSELVDGLLLSLYFRAILLTIFHLVAL
jgi:hypothetical protein